jgi:hypothetical protein
LVDEPHRERVGHGLADAANAHQKLLESGVDFVRLKVVLLFGGLLVLFFFFFF